MTSTEPTPEPKEGKSRGNAGKGRRKGSRNKTTKVLKEAILMAAEQAGEGDMVAYLRKQARDNPGPFLSLLGKVLPLTLEGDKDNPLAVVATIELVAPHVEGKD